MVSFAIELSQAESQLARLIHEVDGGAEILITRGGHPVARIVPAVPDSPLPDRVPGSARGLFEVPEDFDAPLEDFRDYM